MVSAVVKINLKEKTRAHKLTLKKSHSYSISLLWKMVLIRKGRVGI